MVMQVLRAWWSGQLEQCRQNKKKMICTLGQMVCLGLGLVLYVAGLFLSQVDIKLFNIMLLGEFCIFLCCMFFCFENLRHRFLLLTFELVLFVFLMCRPLLNFLTDRKWYKYFTPEAIVFAITSVTVSLLMMGLGAYLCEKGWPKLRKSGKKDVLTDLRMAPGKQNLKDFRLVSLAFYLFTLVFFLVGEMDKLLFMIGRNYEAFFADYQVDYPFFISTLATMMPYALCAYLSTLPSKRSSFCVLALYVLSAVPQFLIGVRNPIVLNALTALMYYCLRDYLKDRETWIGKFEKCALFIALPVGAFALSALNYIRDGGTIGSMGFFDAIVDLFYKQGVSFNVLGIAYEAIPNLVGGPKCFTFGPFIDYFTQNRISRFLFGFQQFETTNSVSRAVYGHNFSHSMSYVAHEDYLNGSGHGSSYLLELYADFGWVGILVGSLILGYLLSLFVKQFDKSWFGRTLILICLTDLFFVPRAEATGWLLFLAQPHFWVTVLACILGGIICTKVQFRERMAVLLKRRKE